MTSDTNMSPSSLAASRGITEIVHFTTSRGLIGILAAKKLLSRSDLTEDDYLENIRYYNSGSRDRDIDWIGHVSMSLTVVNAPMFAASMKWHPADEIWWAVLAFDIQILDHDGVVFCTTNNVYPSVIRTEGSEGLEAMFAETIVWGHFETRIRRSAGMADNLATHNQAELLYPSAVDLLYLTAIYVREEEQIPVIRGLLAAVGRGPGADLSAVRVEHKPSVFVTV